MITGDKIESSYEPINVELGWADYKIVAANQDGTYQMLVFDGYKYTLFVRGRVTDIEAYGDDEGVIYKTMSKETWDSWGKDFPEVTDKEDEDERGKVLHDGRAGDRPAGGYDARAGVPEG